MIVMWKLVAVVLGLAVVPSSAQAYIDPGMGSMVLQGIIAAAVGGLVVIKMYWQRIISTIFKRNPSTVSDKESRASDE